MDMFQNIALVSLIKGDYLTVKIVQNCIHVQRLTLVDDIGLCAKVSRYA